MRTIANPGSLQEAEMIRLNLRAAGIEALIPDEVSANIAPHFFTNRVGVRVQVWEEDEARALEVLEKGLGSIEQEQEVEETAP